MNKIFAANWKMYLNEQESLDFVSKILSNKSLFLSNKVMIFPSHTAISSVKSALRNFSSIQVGMQDCDMEMNGAVTGSNSINSTFVDSCIVGHSERRTIFKENEKIIKQKLENSLKSVESVILCIGETLEEKKQDKTFKVIDRQLSILPDTLNEKKLIIAYEPVWAIGTGMVASNDYIEEVLSYINNAIKSLYSDEILSNINLFYGGSVDEHSVESLSTIPLLDGFLIGSASADFKKFENILKKMR
jgi:triosephosphate isomerase|tara:strand:+ start:2737 stop:3474 length:738 start_codon:yes stop_codon:yes gene_type:complete